MLRLLSYNLLLILFLRSTLIFSQREISSGVYLTAFDFSVNKLSFCKVKGVKYRFRSNSFFNTPFIKIRIGDSIYKINKDSIYGYQTKSKKAFRFYNKKEYEIINPKEKIFIYKKTSFSGNKNSRITDYYFSIKANSEVFSLNKFNLKNEFPTDTLFHEKLDLYFKNDESLTEYDCFYNAYKLSRIFSNK